MIEYINQLRAGGYGIHEAAVEGAVLNVTSNHQDHAGCYIRPLPAAISTGFGSDSQKPFAIVIVAGLTATLLLSVYVLPTMYSWIAADHDILPAYEPDLAEPH